MSIVEPEAPHRYPLIGKVRAVLVGRLQPSKRPGHWTGISKQAVDGPVPVGPLGLEGDEQGDTKVHGGVDKAVHVYAHAHYAYWRQELAGNALALERLHTEGAFGENLSLDALDGATLDEQTVCIGDQWRVGPSTILEVTQGRQPCWKLNDRFGQPDMAARLQRSLRPGWYLRVLKTGTITAGDDIHLLRRAHPEWALGRLMALIDSRSTDTRALREVLTLPLPPSWKRLFDKRLATGEAEAWSNRMEGPAGFPPSP